jgi:hypothetical protein
MNQLINNKNERKKIQAMQKDIKVLSSSQLDGKKKDNDYEAVLLDTSSSGKNPSCPECTHMTQIREYV